MNNIEGLNFSLNIKSVMVCDFVSKKLEYLMQGSSYY